MDDRYPLVILDDMRLDAASGILGGAARLDDINPDDIASVTVLSPAEAVRYGPNAANGVVIIRTREGDRDAPRWRGYAQVGTATPSDRWPTRLGGFDPTNPDSTLRNGGCTLPAVGAGQCVQDSIAVLPSPLGQQLRTALQQQYGLSVSGGGSLVSYYVAGELDGDGSPLSLSRAEIDREQSLGQAVPNSMRYPVHLSGGNATANIRVRPVATVTVDLHGLRVLRDTRAPSFLNDLPNGSGVEFQSGYLPVAAAFRDQNVDKLSRWLGHVDLTWRPTPAFALTALLGHDGSRFHGNREGAASFHVESVVLNSEDLSLGADYDWGPKGLRFLSHLGWEQTRINRDSLECLSITAPGCTGTYQSSQLKYQQRVSSLLLEQHVWIHEALELVGTIRRDHFAHFQHATQTHPAIHASWRKQRLHLHADYGSAGRRPFLFERPETTKEISGGAEFTSHPGSFTIGATLYDMRSHVFAPILFFPSVISPQGTIDNRGIQLFATARLIERENLTLQVEASAWGNRNRLVSMTPPIGIVLQGALRQRSFVGYPVAGFWAERPPSYIDANGDGIVESNEITSPAEEVWAGTPYPTQGAAVLPELALRSVRIGTSFDYQAGHVVFNRNHWYTCSDRQCPEAIDPATPLAAQADVVSGAPTPRYFEKGDFLAWRELWVTLDMPPSVARSVHVKAASVTLAGRNLHTWTGQSGISPEPYAPATAFGQPEAFIEPLMPALRQWSLRIRISY